MSTRTLHALCLLVGCRSEQSPAKVHASLTPVSQLVLPVPVGRHSSQVHLRVPANYVFQFIKAQQLGHLSTDWDEPQIELTSESVDYQNHPRPSPLRDEHCGLAHPDGTTQGDPTFWKVAKYEPRSEGFLIVCQHFEKGHITRTRVVRNWQWEGHPFQCEVRFSEPDVDPSASRVNDAIAICDTVEPREMPTVE